MTTFGFRNNVFSMGDQFTTANSYPRQVDNPADTVMTMVEGPSIDISAAVVPGAGNIYNIRISWRFECGAFTAIGPRTGIATPAAGFAIDRPIGV